LQIKKSKRPFRITLKFRNEVTREVTVQAVDRDAAERKARKRNPSAIGVQRDAA